MLWLSVGDCGLVVCGCGHVENLEIWDRAGVRLGLCLMQHAYMIGCHGNGWGHVRARGATGDREPDKSATD